MNLLLDTKDHRRSSRTGVGAAVLVLIASLVPPIFGEETSGMVVARQRASEALDAERDFHSPDAQLRDLIAVLLKENPAIQSAKGTWRAGLERVPQARSLPDPLVGYRLYAQSPETRVGPQLHALEVSQKIPWKNKLTLQAEREIHTADSIAWQVEALERSLVAELKKAYFEAAYLQEALVVNEEETDLLRYFERIALARYSTGEGIQQAVVKVQTDISRLIDKETKLQQQIDVVRRRIAQLIGRPEATLRLERIELDLLPSSLETEALEDEAIDTHPSVEATRKLLAADDAWVKRRRLEGKPDFRFGLGYTIVGDRSDPAGRLSPPSDNGQDILALSVGLNIPIYRKRIDAGVAEAIERTRSDERSLKNTQDALRYRLQEAGIRLVSYRERSELYSKTIIPQAEESLASAEAAYTTNQQDFLDLLDAERILFQVRLIYERLVADYWSALADIEFAVGKAFPQGGQDQ